MGAIELNSRCPLKRAVFRHDSQGWYGVWFEMFQHGSRFLSKVRNLSASFEMFLHDSKGPCFLC